MSKSLSPEANQLATRMLEELSTLGYGYRSMIAGCFDYCIARYGMATPTEDKNIVVDHVLNILKDTP